MSTRPSTKGIKDRFPSIFGNPDLSGSFSNPQIRASIKANRQVRVVCAVCKGRIYIEHRHDGDYLTCMMCSRERQITDTHYIQSTGGTSSPAGLMDTAKQTAYMREIHHEVLDVLFRDQEGMTVGLIAVVIGHSETAVRSAIDTLIARKMVERVEHKRGPSRYVITQIGADNVL